MASPIGNPANLGSGVDQMLAQIRAMIRDEIQAAASGGAGLHVDGATGDLVADRGQFRSLNYVPGSAGWALTPAGDQELHGNTTIGGNTSIGGTLAVTGTLSLPAGIINNAALASPVAAQYIFLDVMNFGLTAGTFVTKATQTITVPAGFSQAVVQVVAKVGVTNPHTTGGLDGLGGDFIYCLPRIGAVNGHVFGAIIPGAAAGGSGFDITALSTILTGLTGGGTFVVDVQGAVSFANMAANADNEASVSGTIEWLR